MHADTCSCGESNHELYRNTKVHNAQFVKSKDYEYWCSPGLLSYQMKSLKKEFQFQMSSLRTVCETPIRTKAPRLVSNF